MYQDSTESSAALAADISGTAIITLPWALFTKSEYDEARNWFCGVRMRSGVLPAGYADREIDGLQDSSLYEQSVVSLLPAIENKSENKQFNKQVFFETLLMLGSPEAFSFGLEPKKDINNYRIHAQVGITGQLSWAGTRVSEMVELPWVCEFLTAAQYAGPISSNGAWWF